MVSKERKKEIKEEIYYLKDRIEMEKMSIEDLEDEICDLKEELSSS